MADLTRGEALAEDFGIVPIINAGGPNTRHSGSRPRPEALKAMEEMAEVFVRLDELIISAGKRIARSAGVEAATITSGASGGLVLQAAAAITRGDPEIIARLPDTEGIPHELVIQKCHRFVYDRLYLTPGARFAETGSADGCTVDELESAINENTAGVIHLESPFKNRGCVPFETLVEIAHSHDLPVLVDAASMLPPRANLTRFTDAGADLVSFSGGKGIRGPQSSGMLLGKPEWVEYARLNNAPYPGIARAMKVSKEEIAGLVAALDAFLEIDEDRETREYRKQMESVVDQVAEIPGVHAEVVHNYDHYIPHAVVTLTDRWRGPQATEIAERLIAGSPRVYVAAGFGGGNTIWVDPLNIQDGELTIVADRLREELLKAASGH